ncbi:hypothetical protein F0L68_36675, partial [Solihabitans fulvus]
LARVPRGMAGTTVRRRLRTWPKVSPVGRVAARVLAIAGLAVAGVIPTTPARPNGETTLVVPSPTTTSSSPASSRATVGSAAPPASGQPDRTTVGRPTTGAPNSVSPAGSRVSDGPLSAQGAIDPHSTVYWAQSTLTLDTAVPLTALTVEVRSTQTGGVQSTGQWQTGPSDDYTITVQEVGGALVYRWDLKPGRTVPAGQQLFAAQYNHATGQRDADADSYDVRATAADGAHAVRGRFTRTK